MNEIGNEIIRNGQFLPYKFHWSLARFSKNLTTFNSSTNKDNHIGYVLGRSRADKSKYTVLTISKVIFTGKGLVVVKF